MLEEEFKQHLRITLLWYTAWLVAHGPKDPATDMNKSVNTFLEEDEDLIVRFFDMQEK